jgi:hypothetical protein
MFAANAGHSGPLSADSPEVANTNANSSEDFPSPMSSITASPMSQSESPVLASKIKPSTGNAAASGKTGLARAKPITPTANASSIKQSGTAITAAAAGSKKLTGTSTTPSAVAASGPKTPTPRTGVAPTASASAKAVSGRWGTSSKVTTATATAATTVAATSSVGLAAGAAAAMARANSSNDVIMGSNVVKHGWVQKEDLKSKTSLFKPFTHQYFVVDAESHCIKYASTPKVINIPSQLKGSLKLTPDMSVNSYKKPVDRTLMVEIMDGTKKVRMRFIVESLEEQTAWTAVITQIIQSAGGEGSAADDNDNADEGEGLEQDNDMDADANEGANEFGGGNIAEQFIAEEYIEEQEEY